MKEYNVVLLDDEKESLEYSFQAIRNFVEEDRIYRATSVEEVLEVVKTHPVDIAFLDVELQDGNGLELTEYLHHRYPQIKVVVVTGHVDYAVDGYAYEPFDFLIKPIHVMRLEKTFRKLETTVSDPQNRKVMIETGNGFVMVSPKEILYIAKEKNGVEIYCENAKNYRANYTLEYLEGMFDSYGFFRVHQSYLVSTDKIHHVQTSRFGTSYEATLQDGSLIPVSRGKYAKLKEYLVKRSVQLDK